ncbi:SIR2 family NAD-dependent protein deacylase [Bradyrhizobium sp. USDA 4454]
MREQIDTRNTILFVGAGVSQNLGLPSWGDLMDKVAQLLGYDPLILKQLGGYLSLAEYFEIERGSIGPLRSWMDVNWHDKGIEVGNSEVHEALVKARFRKIYTTNFDRWLEKACEHWQVPYRKILTVQDLMAKQGHELEIVKFHGDFDDDATLILTESSYFERLDFESPLDQMLRADVLRHPVLFIGYSLSDINVRYLFHRLAKIWRAAGSKIDRPPSFIFMANPNPVEEAIFQRWGISPIVEPTGQTMEGLRDFLKGISPTH